MLLCFHCQTPTDNPRFCSRQCAATVTNREQPKRSVVTKLCINCGAAYTRSRRKYCGDCRKITWGERSIAEVAKTHNRHAAVREHAQFVARKWPRICAAPTCGYTRHVQVCHRQAIKSFPRDTLLSVVNHPENLLLLCPNHHWEFDHLSAEERGW